MCPYYLDGDLIFEKIGDTRFIGYCAVFKVRGEAVRPHGCPRPSRASRRRTPVSQNSTACGRLRGARTARGPAPRQRAACQVRSTFLVPIAAPARRSTRERAHLVQVLPRKEVIQPQLPLRLPCYDFTPVTSPTFDGSLPCGLGHRLRVLLTPVV